MPLCLSWFSVCQVSVTTECAAASLVPPLETLAWTSATCHIFFSRSLDGAAADSLLFFPGHTWADMHEAQIASGSARECISKAYGSQICKSDNEVRNSLMHNFIITYDDNALVNS